jgi:putative transposase
MIFQRSTGCIFGRRIQWSRPFATVRLRTAKTRGALSRETALTMVFKLCLSAEKRWRRLNGAEQLTALMTGVKFEDGVRVEEAAA